MVLGLAFFEGQVRLDNKATSVLDRPTSSQAKDT